MGYNNTPSWGSISPFTGRIASTIFGMPGRPLPDLRLAATLAYRPTTVVPGETERAAQAALGTPTRALGTPSNLAVMGVRSGMADINDTAGLAAALATAPWSDYAGPIGPPRPDWPVTKAPDPFPTFNLRPPAARMPSAPTLQSLMTPAQPAPFRFQRPGGMNNPFNANAYGNYTQSLFPAKR
jgi:hypothetical protein